MDMRPGRGGAACLLCGSFLLLFCPTVFFLTQRRIQSSESLKLGVTKGLTQALRKAFHQNDVSAHVSCLHSNSNSAHTTLRSRVGVDVSLLCTGYTHTCQKRNLVILAGNILWLEE